MQSKASLDKAARIISAAVAGLFALIIVLQVFLFSPTDPKIIAVMVSSLLVIVYAGAFLYRPLSYVVNDQELVVNRPINNIRIPLHDITSVEVVNRQQLHQSIRTFGVGGLFGYYGKFYHRAFGPMTWYATRRDTGVMITTRDNRKILLTPDEPESIRQLLAR